MSIQIFIVLYKIFTIFGIVKKILNQSFVFLNLLWYNDKKWGKIMLFEKNYNSGYVYFQYVDDNALNIALNEIGIDDYSIKPSPPERVIQRYSVHIFLNGSGKFHCAGKEYLIQAGDVIAIYPGIKFTLTHNSADPWQYFWANFDGEDASKLLSATKFSRENPVYSVQNFKKIRSCIRRLVKYNNTNGNLRLRAIATLLEIFALLSEERLANYINEKKSGKNYYVECAMQYLQQNYRNPQLTIKNLCKDLAISHSHLCMLFKQQTGVSIYHSLLMLRLQQAKLLLERTDDTMTNICIAVGYSTPAYFCSEFKKETGLSPLEYRKKYKSFLKETAIENKFTDN